MGIQKLILSPIWDIEVGSLTIKLFRSGPNSFFFKYNKNGSASLNPYLYITFWVRTDNGWGQPFFFGGYIINETGTKHIDQIQVPEAVRQSTEPPQLKTSGVAHKSHVYVGSLRRFKKGFWFRGRIIHQGPLFKRYLSIFYFFAKQHTAGFSLSLIAFFLLGAYLYFGWLAPWFDTEKTAGIIA